MLTTATLSVTLSDYRSRYDRARGQLDLLRRQADEKAAMLATTRANTDLWDRVRLLLTKTSEFAREQTVRRVESLATSALQAVFGDETLSFRIVLDTRGGQPTADWEVVSQYGDLQVANDPAEARGGGIVDVVSMALRLAVAVLSGGSGDIVLDEPGRCVSAEYAGNLAYFLRRFAESTRRRVVMVTHNAALAEAGDLGYRVTQSDGRSEVERLA